MIHVEDVVNTIYLMRGWKMTMDYYVLGGVEDDMCGRCGEHYVFEGWVEDGH